MRRWFKFPIAVIRNASPISTNGCKRSGLPPVKLIFDAVCPKSRRIIRLLRQSQYG